MELTVQPDPAGPEGNQRIAKGPTEGTVDAVWLGNQPNKGYLQTFHHPRAKIHQIILWYVLYL